MSGYRNDPLGNPDPAGGAAGLGDAAHQQRGWGAQPPLMGSSNPQSAGGGLLNGLSHTSSNYYPPAGMGGGPSSTSVPVSVHAPGGSHPGYGLGGPGLLGTAGAGGGIMGPSSCLASTSSLQGNPYMSGAGMSGGGGGSTGGTLPRSNTGGFMNTVFTSPPHVLTPRDPYSLSHPVLQREYETLRREYESVIQKLNSTMNSIKTFWSPELKRERALRKEESAKLNVLNQQLKISSQDTQKQSGVIRQLTDELQCQYELSRTIRDTEGKAVPREEYDALRLERDRFQREMNLLRATMKELEVQIETQRQTLVARDESIKKLLDLLQSKGMVPHQSVQDRLDLEQAHAQLIEVQNRCHYLEQVVGQRDQDVRVLQEECMATGEKMRSLDRFTPGEFDIHSKNIQIDELQTQVSMLEEELAAVKEMTDARQYTDKTVSQQEYMEMRLKLEKMEIELSQRSNEAQTIQTKFVAAEEQGTDLRKHLEVVKESLATKDQQIALLQSDIEALRGKLEHKNDSIEEKMMMLTQLQTDKKRLESDLASLNEQSKMKESKISILQKKLESTEEHMKEAGRQMELLKARIASSPAVQHQQQLQDQIDAMVREQERIIADMKLDRERFESERAELIDTHQREVRNLRQTIDMLQKELGDKQMLIESQGVKMEDLETDLKVQHERAEISQERLSKRSPDAKDRELESLRADLHLARSEVDRLLKMVQTLEADKSQTGSKMKQLEEQLKESQGKYSALLSDKKGDEITKTVSHTGKDQRIEELEEALRESVSITAEREIAIANQKQHAMMAEQRAQQFKDEVARAKRQVEDLHSQIALVKGTQGDKDAIIQSLRSDRHRHMEEVLELKQEALLAAISEKDAHIALLEMSNNKSPDEVETLRKHKEKLMKKLKEENQKRMKLMNEFHKDGKDVLVNQMDMNSIQLDDTADPGIWA